MNVLLVSANTETLNMVPLPLGLNCVAVATRAAGHPVELLDLMGAEDGGSALLREAVQRLQPAVIGVSVRNVDGQDMADPRLLLPPVQAAIACCRSLSTAPIVLGGAGYSMYPEAMLDYLQADMGIHGEGETAFPALLDRLQRGSDLAGIPGLYAPGFGAGSRSPHDALLDTLPLPDPSLWSAGSRTADTWVPFQARRGCPMNCSYCSTASVEGTAIRTRQPAAVVQGLARHVEAGFRSFYFVDNVFNIPLPYAKALCADLQRAELGIRWRCILYPGHIDEELVQAMAAAGCVEVSLGFESGCARLLRNLNKTYTPAEVVAAAQLLARHGIRRLGFLLLGGPGETRETVLETLAFADALQLDQLRLTAGIRIYPDTALAQAAVRDGFIAPDDDLLIPRFYLARGLEGWLGPTVQEWIAERPHWGT
ncbi:MAG: radical SAM protein [Deferrisomatales bacterium]|nr:radical SAM protein [Deferrisomatales bacterium]